MIRINLLATERATPAAAAAPGALQLYLMLAVAAVASLVVCGLAWWTMTAAIDDLNAQIAAKEQEKQQLEAIAKKVEELQRKEKAIQEQVSLIQDLQTQRDQGMDLLRVVSESLPDFVWLTQLNQTGNRILFKGESSTMTAVADFITQLQQAGENCDQPEPAPNAPPQVKQYVQNRGGCYFKEVDLVTSQVTSRRGASTVNFDLNATFQVPKPPPQVPAAKPGQPATPAPAAQS